MKEVQELVGIVPWTFVAQICNLFLTVFLVKKFLFDRINKVVEERKQMADSQIADATKAKEEAKTMRDQYEASISNATRSVTPSKPKRFSSVPGYSAVR